MADVTTDISRMGDLYSTSRTSMIGQEPVNTGSLSLARQHFEHPRQRGGAVLAEGRPQR
jgi:hypothetical protein